MMDFERLFLRRLPTASAAMAVPLSRSRCLLTPVRAVVRLIAALPGRVTGWVFAQPVVPARGGTELPRSRMGFATLDLKVPLTLAASLRQRALPSWMDFAAWSICSILAEFPFRLFSFRPAFQGASNRMAKPTRAAAPPMTSFQLGWINIGRASTECACQVLASFPADIGASPRAPERRSFLKLTRWTVETCLTFLTCSDFASPRSHNSIITCME